ncbi:MAG: hypothetical protein J5879_00735 [Clostridia bacterium]|nr:hypothetical protein [Clostridia bacterium]
MDFLSKLFGKDNKDAKEALDLLKKLADESAKAAPEKKPEEKKPAPQPQRPAEPEYDEPEGPSGDSWGPRMPDEENQFNYKGTYTEYFENIFSTEFSAYRVEKERSRYSGKIIVYTFFEGARKALVVELMSSSSESKKIRRDCAAQGIPYLRYYYDYDGWWNTRSYVIRRTREALSG